MTSESEVRELIRRGDPAAVASLLEIVSGDGPLEVRASALMGLGRLHAEVAIPGLIALWRRSDTDRVEGALQMGAFDVLTTIGAAAIPALVAALRDPAWNVRYYAVKTLDALGAPGVADDLAPLVRDPHPLVSQIAQRALETLRWR